MSILFGSDKIGSIYVDTDKIGKIYVDTDLVYISTAPTPPTPTPTERIIYDTNTSYLTYHDDPDYPDVVYCESGHTWQISDPRCTWFPNDFTRPSYTACGKYDMSNCTTTGKIRLWIDGSSSYQDLQHNAHYVGNTSNISMDNIDKMYVTVNRSPNSCYMKFGLLPMSAPDSFDTSNGGYLSELISVGSGDNTYSITIPNGIISSTRLYPIINIRGSAKYYSWIDIKKVWFTYKTT